MPVQSERRGSLSDARLHSEIEDIAVSAYTIPTDFPESDGTIAWDKTTIVVVEVSSAGERGLGYSYADLSTADLIRSKLCEEIRGKNAMDIGRCHQAMLVAIRNLGRPGITAMAISAVDIALWDLKARMLSLPLFRLLGAVRDQVPIYGSGGFTSYSIEQLQSQLAGWASSGIAMVKMKIGRHPQDDVMRVRAAREAIRPCTQLFVDANGAYSRKQALSFAEKFCEFGVNWFEEPVSSDDLEGLHLIRDRALLAWTLPRGNMGMSRFIFGACWSMKASMFCKRTLLGAAALLVSCRPGLCVLPGACRSRRTRRLRSTRISVARCNRSAIWNIFMTTSGLSACVLMVCWNLSKESCGPILSGQEWG